MNAKDYKLAVLGVIIVFAGVSGLARAACTMRFVASDRPVVFENALVRVVVDPSRGGTVSSFVFKPAGADLTATWQDQPVGQGFGLFIDRVTTPTRQRVRDYETSAYVAEVVVNRPEEVAVKVTGISPSGVGKVFEFAKTYKLRAGSAELTVDYSVANIGRTPIIASIWTTHVARAANAAEPLLYYYPTPRGTRVERYSRTPGGQNIFVKDAPAGWCGAMGGSNHLGLAMAMSYPTLGTLYSYFPGKTANQDFPTLEWWTQNILLKPVKALEGEAWAGKPWTTQVRVMPLRGLSRLDGYARGLAAGIEVRDGRVAISLLSVIDRRADVTVSIGPPVGKPTRTKTEIWQLEAGRPTTRICGEMDEKAGRVVRVEARDRGKLILRCERPVGSKEALAGYALKPREPKLLEAKIDASKRLTRAFVTSHVKWATPSKYGKVKALFMVRSSMQREIVELAQRMDLDFTVIPTQYSHYRATASNAGLMFYYPGFDPVPEFHAALAKKKWDAVCICTRHWRLVPEKTRKLLLARIREGMALINVNPQRLTPDVRAVFKGPQSAAGSAVVRANVPFAELPILNADPTGERWVTAIELGKGRVVGLNYYTTWPNDRRSDMTSLTPAIQSGARPEWRAHEYYYSLIARAFLWATKRLPEEPMRFDLRNAENVRLGQRCEAQVKVPNAGGRRLRFSAHSRADEMVASSTVKLSADGIASIALPRMNQAGLVFLDVWLLDGNQVLDWGTATMRVRSPVTSVSVQVPDTAYVPGSDWTVAVAVEADTRVPGAKMRLAATDACGRIVWLADRAVNIKPGANRWDLPLRMENPLTVRHKLRVAISANVAELGAGEGVVYAKIASETNFSFLVWGAGWVSHLSSVARQQLKTIGATTYEVGARVQGRRHTTNESLRSRCDEILRDDMAVALQNINWMGGYAAKDNPLARLYCLDDPAYMQSVIDGIRHELRGLDKMDVRVCSTGDEISIGRYAGFNDLCQSRHSVAAFRRWLSTRYESISALNREWDTDYGAFADVPGIKWADVENKPNRAPWAEFRTFMETRLTNYLGTFDTEIAKVIPGAHTGFDGNSTLCSYNGFDWWRISGVTDMLTLYRTAAAEHYLGSFYRARGVKPHFSMWLSASAGKSLSYRPWAMLFKGMTGVDYWYEPLLLNPDFTINEYAARLGEQVTEIQEGIGTLILSAGRERDPIAILYSQPSVHAATIEGQSGQPGTVQLNNDHFAWAHLTDDAGFTAEFVSYEQLANGYLQEAGYRALILPLCYALSRAEIAQIESFVKAGGMLVADSSPGLYNAHARRLRTGQLDKLLGVRRSGPDRPSVPGVEINVPEMAHPFRLPWPAADRNIEIADGKPLGQAKCRAATKTTEFGGMLIRSRPTDSVAVPTVVTARRGGGHTCYLNLPIWRYKEIRGTDRGQQLVGLVQALLGRVEVDPPLPVKSDGRSAPELATTRFSWGEGLYVGLMKALNCRSGKQRGTVKWHRPGFAYDVRAKRLLGRHRETTLALSEERPQLLAWLPYEVTSVTAAAPLQAKALAPARVEFAVRSSTGRATHHVLRCTVADPSGEVRSCYTRNVVAEDGHGVYDLTLALNDPAGEWTVRAEDVVSGKRAEAKVRRVPN